MNKIWSVIKFLFSMLKSFIIALGNKFLALVKGLGKKMCNDKSFISKIAGWMAVDCICCFMLRVIAAFTLIVFIPLDILFAYVTGQHISSIVSGAIWLIVSKLSLFIWSILSVSFHAIFSFLSGILSSIGSLF